MVEESLDVAFLSDLFESGRVFGYSKHCYKAQYRMSEMYGDEEH